MQSKFAKAHGRGKTPSICKHSPPPFWFDVPVQPVPDLRDQYVQLGVSYQAMAPWHPWMYASVQLLRKIAPDLWYTGESTDPDFTFIARFWWRPASGTFTVRCDINHMGHGPHRADRPLGPYDHGQPFYIPRMNLVTDNDTRYKCDVSLSI